MICPTQMFNLTDTISGHWYFDDISVVQNTNVQLIINGGFETN